MNALKKSIFRLRLAAVVFSVALFLLIPSLVGAWNNKLVVNTDYGKLTGYLSGDKSYHDMEGCTLCRTSC